jgi:hypothetical protein
MSVNQFQTLEMSAVVASVARQKPVCLRGGVCANEEIRHNPFARSARYSIGLPRDPRSGRGRFQERREPDSKGIHRGLECRIVFEDAPDLRPHNVTGHQRTFMQA